MNLVSATICGTESQLIYYAVEKPKTLTIQDITIHYQIKENWIKGLVKIKRGKVDIKDLDRVIKRGMSSCYSEILRLLL